MRYFTVNETAFALAGCVVPGGAVGGAVGAVLGYGIAAIVNKAVGTRHKRRQP